MRILLVDDDATLMESLAERLVQQRYAVDIAADGSSAQSYIDLFNYDLVVLDLMLPDGDGIQFCQQFRREGYANPLMVLTAKERTAEKVRALDAGADDYIVKPFDFDELCARIRALLRRDAQGLPPVLQWGPLALDPSTCETSFRQQPVRLTPKEFSMMELFLRHPHRVYSLGAIIDDLWSFEDSPGEDAIRTHIKGLRRKLQAAGAPKDLIKTVYGLGYRLNQEIDWTREDAPVLAAQSEGDTSAQLISQAIAQSCRRYLSSASQKIAVLEAAARSLSSGTLDPELQYAGQINAHQLAGSLGCFGLAEGSKIARQIETQLRAIALFSAQPTPNRPSSNQLSQWAVPLPESIAELVKALRENVDQAAAAATGVVSASVPLGMPLLLIVSGDENLTEQLVQAAAAADLQTQVAATLDQADHLLDPVNRLSQVVEASYWSGSILYNPVSSLAACAAAVVSEQMGVSEGRSPDLLLLDIPTATSFPALLQQIRQDYAMPVAVLGNGLTLPDRLSLLKQGVALVSDRSAPPPQIIEAAASLLRANSRPIRIAIADADPQTLALLEINLEPQGFQVQTFENTLDLWQWLTADETPDRVSDEVSDEAQTLSETPASAASKIDILLLDIEMPEIDGIEICRVLRADTRFRSLPIVFLAVRQEDSLRMQAFQAGADDVINQAVAPIELATRLRNQLSSDCRPAPVRMTMCQIPARTLAGLS